MTVDIDTRMRAASASLRRASEGLAPERPPQPRSRALVVIAALFAGVVVAAGVAATRQDDDRRDQVTAEQTPSVPRLVPDEFPSGLPAPMALDLPATGSPVGTDAASIAIYGDPTAADPLAGHDLAVVDSATDLVAIAILEPDAGEAVTVRGHQGTTWDDPRMGTVVAWDEAADRHIVVASHTLDRAQLVAIADALTVDAETAALSSPPPEVPGPLERIGRTPDFPLASLALGLSPSVPVSSRGHMAGNETEDYDRGLFVTTATGDAFDLAVIRWVSQAGQAVEVRGHAGWMGGYDQDGVARRTLIWEESPGVIALVQSSGYTEAELQAAAEGLRPARTDEWEAMVDEWDALVGGQAPDS